VVAPSLIPTTAGGLTAVWVPNTEQAAMRDLTRARDDMKAQELKTCQ